MNNAPERILTERLSLTRPGVADVQDIFERYGCDPDVTRYMGWPRHRSLADSKAFLELSDEQWRRWRTGPYLIWSRTEGTLLGSTGFEFDAHSLAMTGYVLAKDAWGQGYATEAVTTMVGLADTIGLSELYALCHPQHPRSARVLEKCGFVQDVRTVQQMEFPNLTPGVMVDVLCYRRFGTRAALPT